MSTIKVIDFETNGLAPDADAWEYGWQDVVQDQRGWFLGRRDCYFLYSAQPADPEAQAIHHITEAMVRDAYPLERGWRRSHGWGTQFEGEVIAYAAHNTEMEKRYATEELTRGLPWVCTMKCAMRVWPECPSFKNQVIRYWLGLEIPPQEIDLANNAHSADGDAYVTAHILMKLLELHPLETLIQWSSEPKQYPRLTFGMHKGLAWPAVPYDYLDWMVFKSGRDGGGMEDWQDWILAARREMRRRQGGAYAT
jgi:exodeoxyribonuclease X